MLKASPQFNPQIDMAIVIGMKHHEAAKEAYDFCISQGIKLTDKYSDNWLVDRELGGCISVVIYSNPDKTAAWENTIRPASLSRE